MKSLIIPKYDGTKNTFFIVDLTLQEAAVLFDSIFPEGRIEFVKKVTQLAWGHEADGVLFLEPPSAELNEIDLVWAFYNRDGSIAEMCGNAARCATLYCLKKSNKNSVCMQTRAGSVIGRLENDLPVVTMPEAKEVISRIEFEFNGVHGFGRFINTGVPHFVILVDGLDFGNHRQRQEHFQLASFLRRHSQFGKGGSNITFVERGASSKAKTYTFERGVEDFTKSCGTGAVAAAYALKCAIENKRNSYDLLVPGGELSVNLENLNRPILSGGAQFCYEINFQGGE